MDSKYASPEKDSHLKIMSQFSEIKDITFISDILDALPYVAAILNDQRQIIYSNQIFLERLGNISMEQILGNRTGEVLNCANANIEPGGCGTNDKCRYCGAVNAVLISKMENKKTSLECNINSVINNEVVAHDFLVTATPVKWKDKNYTILVLNDISSEKRRKTLERIFFHDVLNKAGSLSSFLEIVKDIKDEEQLNEIMDLASIVSRELTDEIIAQKNLLDAENNEYKLSLTKLSANDLLESLKTQWDAHPLALEKKIHFKKNQTDVMFISDATLIKRILINMLKNALEASKANDIIKLGYKHDSENNITFWVNNPAVLPDRVQKQLFSRNFSTKSFSRGLGTYSMKLLGENYLNGKVWFESNETDKTTFFLEIPKEIHL